MFSPPTTLSTHRQTSVEENTHRRYIYFLFIAKTQTHAAHSVDSNFLSPHYLIPSGTHEFGIKMLICAPNMNYLQTLCKYNLTNLTFNLQNSRREKFMYFISINYFRSYAFLSLHTFFLTN